MRLIDADTLKEYIGCADAVKYGNKTAEQQHNSYSTLMMYEIADYIDDAPTVDAEPVRHGEWVNGMQCSKCKQVDTTKPNYCPNCGAKMEKNYVQT